MSNQSLSNLYTLAVRANNGTSFFPEKRAQSIVNDYSNELDSDIKSIKDAGTLYSVNADTVNAACTEYRSKYERHLSNYLHSESRVYSPMITGPARFPVARMEKLRGYSQNKYQFFREWRTRALSAIIKGFMPKVNTLSVAQHELEKAYRVRDFYNKINYFTYKFKGNEPKQRELLAVIGVSEADQLIILSTENKPQGVEPKKMNEVNNLIESLNKKIKQLQSKPTAEPQQPQTVKGVEIIHNIELDRLQLKFPDKPTPEIIALLKKNAFKWSPTQKVWQRQLTSNAIYAANHVLTQLPE